jgi:hypothetical protein
MKAKGQALLPLLILIIIILSLGAAAIELAIGNILIDRYFQDGMTSFYTVEAALENAFLRTLRDPAYVGESLQINEASCTIEISGEAPRVVNAGCNNGRQIRKMRAEISFSDGIMAVENIREIE